MIRPATRLLPLLLLIPSLALAQMTTPPHAGGPQPTPINPASPDEGPANQAPRTDSPQAVHRGTDGSAVGLEQPGGTGTTPQGMEGDATAGARNPNAPVGTPPPISRTN